MSVATWLDPWLRITGIALAVIASLALFWSLRGDRSRGRRRCPRCWYDFSGVSGLVCPECGKVIASERRLLKPRRRWRSGAVALVLLAGSVGLAMWPALRSGGWSAAVPGWILVRVAPYEPGLAAGRPRAPLDIELRKRIESRKLTDSQMQVALDRYLIAYPEKVRGVVHTRERWPSNSEISVTMNFGPELLWTDRSDMYAVTCRLRIHDDQNPGAPFFDPKDPYPTFTRQIGCARTDGPLVLDIELWENGRRLWTGTKQLPTIVGGTVDDLLTPVNSPDLTEKMKAFLKPRLVDSGGKVGMIVQIEDRSIESIFGPDMAFGFDVEVLRNGVVVAQCLHTHTRTSAQVWNGPSFAFAYVDWHEPAPSSLEGAEWSIRIRGNAKAALRDFDRTSFILSRPKPTPTKYWAGSFTVPVTAFARTR